MTPLQETKEFLHRALLDCLPERMVGDREATMADIANDDGRLVI